MNMTSVKIDKSRLSVKNVKLHEDMSEETACFSAVLCIDGKKAAEISNRGQGGCNNYYPINGFTHAEVNFTDIDLDCYIMELVEDYNLATKLQSKNFVLKKSVDNGIPRYYQVKFKRPLTQMKKFGNYTTYMKNTISKFEADGFVVLNRNL